MQLEVGRRYRLSRYDGLADCDGILALDAHGGFIFRPDGARFEYLVEKDGGCFGIGRLCEIAPAPAPLRPTFGSDAAELDRLRRTFATWDFRCGT